MINIIKTKNVCARIAWIIEIYAGKNNKTVIHYGISEANHGIPWNTEGGLFELIWDFFKSNIQE